MVTYRGWVRQGLKEMERRIRAIVEPSSGNKVRLVARDVLGYRWVYIVTSFHLCLVSLYSALSSRQPHLFLPMF